MSEFTVDPVIQKLTVQLADWPLCRVFLYNDSRYQWGLLVPRRPGAIEMCDLVPEDQAKLMPSLRGWALADHWAGLRPKSPDGLPLLGPSGRDGVFIAGGQYRNGILFAPAIAQEMADIILGKGAVIPDFDPQRFSRSSS